jgi:hypothetical protein
VSRVAIGRKSVQQAVEWGTLRTKRIVLPLAPVMVFFVNRTEPSGPDG